MEVNNIINLSNEYLKKLDAEATNIKIKSISAINNEISIHIKNMIAENSQVSWLLYDKENKRILYKQAISYIDLKSVKITLDENSFAILQENSMINKIRICLLENIDNEYKLYYLKNVNSKVFGSSISMAKQFENNQEVLLYYSAAGLLSVKIVNKNKMLFNIGDILLTEKNIVVKKVDKNKLSIVFSEDIPKCLSMELLIINGSFKLDSIKTSNVIGNIGDIVVKGTTQMDINWDASVLCRDLVTDVQRYCLVLKCIYEEYTEFMFLTREDFMPRDRFVYDVRSNYCEPYIFDDRCAMIPYFGNKGIMIMVTEPHYVYREQFTAILENINLDNESILISVKCRKINGEYKGIMLCDTYTNNERFIPCMLSDSSGPFVNMSVKLFEADFFGLSENIEIYTVFETKGNSYYIPIVAGDNTLVRTTKNAEIFVENKGIATYALLSSKNKLYFKKKFVLKTFDSKHQQKSMRGLSFEEAISAIDTIKPLGTMYGEIVCTQGNNLILGVNSDMQGVSDIALIYLNESNSVSYVQNISLDMWNAGELAMNAKCFEGYVPNKDTELFRVCVLVKYKDEYFYSKLRNLNKKDNTDIKNIYDRRDSYYSSIADVMIAENTYKVLPYYAMNGLISICVTKEELIYSGQFSTQLDEVRIYGNELELKATCMKLDNGKWIGFKLKYRGKRKEDNESYVIPSTENVDNESNVVIKSIVDLKKIHLKMIFWDIFCVFEIEGKQYDVRAFCNGDKLSKHYEKVLCKDYYLYKDDNSILYPYMTKTNTVALAHREYYPKHDTTLFKMKEKLALNIYKKNKEYFDSKNIYLIYEKYCTAAQDNGYYFFKYCMENNVEEQINGKIYYVIDKKSNEYNNVAKYDDHVLDFTSLKHMIYLLAARMYISTDTKEHSYVYRAKGSILLPYILEKEYLFLQHGVIALKKIDHVYSKGKFGQCKKFVVSSDYERDIVAREFKYDNKDLIVTGLARWDVLEDKSEGKRKIMIVPTWRSWLDDVENDTFVNSNYFKSYMELLNDSRLYKLLEEYDVTADFYIHIKFKDYIHNFDSRDTSRVRLIVFGEQPLNELMMECKLLITDYSSVSWDIYYQKKPVLFYQFDIDDYMFAHGSYIDFETELFGDRAQNLDRLFELLEDYMKSDFELKPKYASIQQGYFKYIDNNNCKRIWDEVKKIHNAEFNNK